MKKSNPKFNHIYRYVVNQLRYPTVLLRKIAEFKAELAATKKNPDEISV